MKIEMPQHRSCAVLLNYKLTEEQIQELINEYNVDKDKFIEPPVEISTIWKSITNEFSLNELKSHTDPIINWLDAIKPSVCVTEGDLKAFLFIYESRRYCIQFLIPTYKYETVEYEYEQIIPYLFPKPVKTKVKILKHEQFVDFYC